MNEHLDLQEKIKPLSDEIERLHDEVAAELSDNKEDAAFAFKTLLEADELLLYTPHQYAEARYRVALVKTALVRKKQLRQQARTWDSLVSVSTLIWLIVIIAAFGFDNRFGTILRGSSEGIGAAGVAWFTALAGALGGVINVLYSLSWRLIVIRSELDLRVYLQQPVVGFVLGGVIFFTTQTGLSFFSFISNQEGFYLPSVIILQMLIAFIVGFRQRMISHSPYKDSDEINVDHYHPPTHKSLSPVDTEKYLRGLGKKRDRLFDEIEQLYDEVELLDNREDAAFAFTMLSEAQDLLLQTPHRYAEARYLFALVKTILIRKKNRERQPRSWNSLAFVYTLIWLIAIIAAFVFYNRFSTTQGSSEGLAAARAVWFTALAGALGGVISILYSMIWRIGIKREFGPQYLKTYLGRPVIGFVIGIVISLFAQTNLQLFSFISNQEGLYLPSLVVAIQMLIAFFVGFRQRIIIYIFDKIRVTNKTNTSIGVDPSR